MWTRNPCCNWLFSCRQMGFHFWQFENSSFHFDWKKNKIKTKYSSMQSICTACIHLSLYILSAKFPIFDFICTPHPFSLSHTHLYSDSKMSYKALSPSGKNCQRQVVVPSYLFVLNAASFEEEQMSPTICFRIFISQMIAPVKSPLQKVASLLFFANREIAVCTLHSERNKWIR